jgi:3'(2'), 5'-bisphosphate nucleotidase
MQELLAWVPGVKEIAREAGRILHEIYHGGQFERQLKEDATPVTSADLAADAYLKQALSALTPHVPVLTEEAADIPFSQRANWRQYWLVDPLDGTGEFIAGSGDFATLIALVRDNVPVLSYLQEPRSLFYLHFSLIPAADHNQSSWYFQDVRYGSHDHPPFQVESSSFLLVSTDSDRNHSF